jgi:hypothetical protein
MNPSFARAAPSGDGEEEWRGEVAREGGAARSSWSLEGATQELGFHPGSSQKFVKKDHLPK